MMRVIAAGCWLGTGFLMAVESVSVVPPHVEAMKTPVLEKIAGGFGQAIIAEMMSAPERFNLFLASPQLVSRPDVHIGYNPIYEYAALPDVDEVVAAVRTTME